MKPENQPSSAHKADTDPAVGRANSNHGSKWTDILDVAAKLIGAGAVVAATIIANRYQSSMTVTNLLVQREQADTNLRAAMFHDLIDPIVGSGNNKGDVSVDRELLLAELLALNFHEHFELKPLMMHVDDRLAHEESKEMDHAQREDARESLRFAARRVIQRQLSTLTKAERASSPEQQACIYYLQVAVRNPKKSVGQTPPPKPCSKLKRYFDDLISIRSPSGIYTLAFTINNTPKSWESQSFYVSMGIAGKEEDDKDKEQIGAETKKESSDDEHERHIAGYDFLLTWFDFPLSDNTLLADGTRFSLVIDRVEPFLKRVTLKLIWFPEDYFSAQERPTNYRQCREKLGLTVEE